MTNTQLQSPSRRMLAYLLAFVLAVFACCGLSACSSEDEEQAVQAEDAQNESEESEEEQPGYVAHGSTFSKSETVAATTTMKGKVTAIAVDEWIKNPKGLTEIEDESSLQQIASDNEDVTYTQDGDKLTWQTNGMDIRYTGITDQKLPFTVKYTYKLDGKKVSPSELQGATGKLKITISYEDIQKTTINVNGWEQKVTQPYAMATIVAFDAEHAKNVTVDAGTVMDQDGSYMAVGIAMPELADTLDLGDELSIPEKVTITADVKGFELPSITTMATNQALSSLASGETTDNASNSISSAFGQVSSVQDALGNLSQGVEGIGTALNTIKDGQDKLNTAFPNATDGLASLQGVSDGVTQALSGAQASNGGVSDALTKAEESLEALKQVDTEALSDEEKTALTAAIDDLQANIDAAKQGAEGTSTALEGAATASAQLTAGLGSVNEGLSQLQQGYTQLTAAMGTVSDATGQLAEGVNTMSDGVGDMISQLQSTLQGKIDLVQALGEAVKAEGAYCGSDSDMEASTTFIITADPEA